MIITKSHREVRACNEEANLVIDTAHLKKDIFQRKGMETKIIHIYASTAAIVGFTANSNQ